MTTLTRKQCKELFVRGDNIEQRKWNDFIDTMFSSVDSASWTLVGTEDFTITSTATTTTVFSLTANSLTTGTAMLLTSSGTITTTGEILNVVGNSATTCTGLIRGSGTALTDGWVAQLTGGGANITASGGVLDIVCGASTLGSGLRITSTGVGTSTTVGLLAQLVADSMTTGVGVYASFDGLTTGEGVNLTSSGTIVDGGSLFRLTASGVNTGGTTNGTVFDITSTNQVAGIIAKITASGAITGNVMEINATNQTDGNLLVLTGGGAGMTAGASLAYLDGSGATVGLLLDIVGTNLTTGTALNIDAGAGIAIAIDGRVTIDGTEITAGNVFDLNTLGLTTGSLMDYTAITAKTSGYLFNGSMTTSVLDASTLIDDFSISCAHDGLAADTLRGKRITWTGGIPNGTGNASLAIFEGAYTTGTIGSGGAEGGVQSIYKATMSGTINGSAVDYFGLLIDGTGATVTSANTVAAIAIDESDTIEYFVDLSGCNGANTYITSDSGTVATVWKARIKVKTDDGTDAWINCYSTSNEA